MAQDSYDSPLSERTLMDFSCSAPHSSRNTLLSTAAYNESSGHDSPPQSNVRRLLIRDGRYYDGLLLSERPFSS